MEAYGPLAEWFEYLNDDCDYASWSQYFIDGLSSLGAGPCGLELGCGSGAFCRLLTRAGYLMEGADLSPAMLTKAEQLAREEGLRIPFFRADASALKAPKQYDFILSPNDCFNYIPQKMLPSAFSHAAKAIRKGGIFWLDISSAYKLRHKVADNISAEHSTVSTNIIPNISMKRRTFRPRSKRRGLPLSAPRGTSGPAKRGATD